MAGGRRTARLPGHRARRRWPAAARRPGRARARRRSPPGAPARSGWLAPAAAATATAPPPPRLPRAWSRRPAPPGGRAPSSGVLESTEAREDVDELVDLLAPLSLAAAAHRLRQAAFEMA